MLRKGLRLTILSVLLVAFVAPFALAQSEWQQPKPYPKDAKAFPYTGDRQDLPQHREAMSNTVFICIACGLGMALLLGVGKMIYDVKKTRPVAHMRQPWEGR